MLIDLQLHSTYSDGYLTPTQVVKFIKQQGVQVAALTDHNTVGGLNEFRTACRAHRIRTITGLELYARLDNRKFSLLWYNFDDTNPELHNILRDSQRRRRRLVRQALIRLKHRGFKIEIDKTLDKYNHYVPINHIVDDLKRVPLNLKKIKRKLKTNYPAEGQIIAQYFRNPDIGKLKNSYISFERILKLRQKIKGQLVLCHPAKHSYIRSEAIGKFKKIGIDGIEKLSPHHSFGAVMQIQHLAREFDLIEVGGSDFHRTEGDNFKIQHAWQYYKVDAKNLNGVNKIIS